MTPDRLAQELRSIYRADPVHAATLIELYLKEQLSMPDPGERCTVLEDIRSCFKPGGGVPGKDSRPIEEVWSEVVSLLLGRKVSLSELQSSEFLERLSSILNTLFESINEIMDVINSTLTGGREEFATIRHVIGESVSGRREPLEAYLRKIKDVFLISHNAFQMAASRMIQQLLSELDPENMEAGGTGLKFGPLRKAESYDMYRERFRRCESWFKSGRFREELLREFERNCQALLQEKGLNIKT